MTNSSEPSLKPKKMPSNGLSVICLFYLFASKYNICSPRGRHGPWTRRALNGTLECREPICGFHSTGNDRASSATCSGSMTTPCNSRVAVTKVRTFSLTSLTAFSTTSRRAPSHREISSSFLAWWLPFPLILPLPLPGLFALAFAHAAVPCQTTHLFGVFASVPF